MVPNVAKAGTSFKGAGLYYLHDKRQDDEEVGHQEPHHPAEDRTGGGEIPPHPLDDEDVEPDGGRNQADFDDHDHDDSEPDQIKTQSLDQGYEDRYGGDGAGEGNRTLI